MFHTSDGVWPDRHAANVLPKILSPASLLAATEAGRLVWARSDKGPLVKAGGRVPEGLHAGREIWITLVRMGREYQLALTTGLHPYGDPMRERDGWFRRCDLGRLWAAVARSLAGPAGGPPGRGT